MNKPKYTSGPWKYRTTKDDKSIKIIGDYTDWDFVHIAKLPNVGITDEANARLIAAAPTLYKACDDALSLLCHVGYVDGTGEINMEVAMETIVSLKNALSAANPEVIKPIRGNHEEFRP